MLDSVSLETAAENIIQLLTALKPHVTGKQVEKDTGINANLEKIPIFQKRDMPILNSEKKGKMKI